MLLQEPGRCFLDPRSWGHWAESWPAAGNAKYPSSESSCSGDDSWQVDSQRHFLIILRGWRGKCFSWMGRQGIKSHQRSGERDWGGGGSTVSNLEEKKKQQD